MNLKKIWIIVFYLIILSSLAYAVELPPGLLKIIEYNEQSSKEFLQNISFAIAFLAGITSIVSPCILPLLPGYFAITFKERKRITLATAIFFLGFSTAFILMGIVATFTGSMLSSAFRDIGWLVPLAGILLIILGIMLFLGKGFPGISIARKMSNDFVGIFIAGLIFAVGWTACVGPIVSGILIMAATFNNYLTSIYLMFAYSLGIFVPMFILSFFYDKFKIDKIKWLNKSKDFKIGNKKFHTNIPNIVAGVIFILMGLVFVIFQGTRIINGLQMFGLKQYFYSLQNLFMSNFSTFNTIGLVVFSVFVLVLIYFIRKDIKQK